MLWPVVWTFPLAKHISDHCPISMRFHVAGDARNVDWMLCLVHVPSAWLWGAAGAALAANLNLVHQHAIEDKDHKKACCLLRSLIVHAAGDAGMAHSVCSQLHPARGAVRDPPWFDAHCKEMRCVFCEVVQSGQAKLEKEQYRTQCAAPKGCTLCSKRLRSWTNWLITALTCMLCCADRYARSPRP